jgi:hypothetical protein
MRVRFLLTTDHLLSILGSVEVGITFLSREKIMHRVSVPRFVGATLVLLGGLTVTANAQKVLFDFGSANSFRGVNVLPNPDINNNTWNEFVPGATVTNLVSTTGATTPIGITWTTNVGTDSYNGPYGGPTNGTQAQANSIVLSAALGDLDNSDAAYDFAAGTGDPTLNASNTPGVGGNLLATQFTLSGLTPTQTYSLTFYGSHIFDTQTTTYSVYNNPAYVGAVGLEGTASLNTEFTDPITTGQDPNLSNDVTITGLVPTATGNLYVEFFGDTNGPPSSGDGVGYLNSMELVGAVPEPATLGLLMGGLGSLLLARRRTN